MRTSGSRWKPRRTGRPGATARRWDWICAGQRACCAFYDPASGQYLPTSQEQIDALRAAENARQVAEDARQIAENARQQEAAARQAAESEAAELREQLRRLRGG